MGKPLHGGGSSEGYVDRAVDAARGGFGIPNGQLRPNHRHGRGSTDGADVLMSIRKDGRYTPGQRRRAKTNYPL